MYIDGDEQGTVAAFTELRTIEKGNPGYTAVVLQGGAIRTQVRQLAPKYSDVVIDVGGRDTGSLRAALSVSDMLLIPVKPRSFDLWGVDQTADLVQEAREINEHLRAIVVINEADSQGKDNEAALNALQKIEGIEVAPLLIVRRKAFPNAAIAGLSVLESEYDDPKSVKGPKGVDSFTGKGITLFIGGSHDRTPTTQITALAARNRQRRHRQTPKHCSGLSALPH